VLGVAVVLQVRELLAQVHLAVLVVQVRHRLSLAPLSLTLAAVLAVKSLRAVLLFLAVLVVAAATLSRQAMVVLEQSTRVVVVLDHFL
jgi:hypothetical protein